MSSNPSKRFGIESEIKVGAKANFTVFNLTDEYQINPDEFLSKGKSMPFAGKKVYGKCLMTVCKGKVAYTN